MTVAERLEQAVRTEHHASARNMAKAIYRHVLELEGEGESRDVLLAALGPLYERYRRTGQTVARDALAEVMDALEDDTSSSQSA